MGTETVLVSTFFRISAVRNRLNGFIGVSTGSKDPSYCDESKSEVLAGKDLLECGVVK